MRSERFKNFSSSINQIQAQAIVKKVSAQLDGVQAIANLFKETTDKKKMAIETANSKAKEIESFGQSEAKRTHKTNDDSIARINAIAKQTLGKHGTTAEGKAAADKAVMEATKSVIEKLQNNANETASGALETAAGAAGKQRDAGNKFVEEFGKNQSSIIQNIQESVTATVGQIDNAAQKHKENLLDGKSKTLASIQSLRQVVVSGLQTDGKLAETGMRKLGHASANQLDSFAVHGMQQLNANAGKIVEQINSADAKGRRLKKDDEESFPKKVNAAITEGRTGLETVMDEHSENADSNSEKLSQQSLYHLDELSGKSMARAGQFVNTIGSNLSKVHDKAGSQFAQIRVEGQNIHQQGIQKYGESLQQQINSEAQKWDQNKTKTTGDIKAKVDEGLASHFEAEAHAAADFDTAAKKAADDAESSTAWKIIKGIASAAWEFIKGLALFVLIVVIVAIVLFLIVADAVGIFFAVLAIGAILEIALIVVGIGFLVYGLVTSLITRFKQLIATVPAGTPWYDWIALGYLTVIIAVGDVVGVTPIIEGSMGEEAITGRKLTTEERAAKITGGILQIATLFLGEAIRKAGGGGGPAEPVDPVKPVEPGKTVEPGDPTKQLEPDKPTETDKPVEPNKPTTSDTPEHGAKFKEDPVPSADGPERRLGIDDEGKCEVCASPCKEILEKYADVMDPATEAEINAIENDASLTDAEKIERLKPIEKKLANAKLLKAPKIRKEDVTDGPHGPDRPIIDVISRALKDNKPQGRWLSRSAGENAVANLDTSKMVPGKPFSVSIPEGAGEVVRPTEISNRKLPPAERVVEEPAKKAVVILGKDGIIHSFPIGPEHPAFNNNAPLKN